MPNGEGATTSRDGGRCEGTFVDGKMEGQGIFTFGDDNASWEGMWISDSAIGIGTWHFDCDEPTGEGSSCSAGGADREQAISHRQ